MSVAGRGIAVLLALHNIIFSVRDVYFRDIPVILDSG